MLKKKKLKNGFNLIGKKIVFGKIVGHGLRKQSVPVLKTRIGGKEVVTKEIKPDVGLLERLSISKQICKSEERYMRNKVINAQRVWRAFFEIGLPVPKFSKVDLRRNVSREMNPHYLNRYMENLELKYGKLYVVHSSSGRPVFLSGLSVKRDRKLIKLLAQDLAKIHNLGFAPDFVDFWHFYKKPKNGWGRVILDFEDFTDFNRNGEVFINNHFGRGVYMKGDLVRCNLVAIMREFGPIEWKKFISEYNLLAKEKVKDDLWSWTL